MSINESETVSLLNVSWPDKVIGGDAFHKALYIVTTTSADYPGRKHNNQDEGSNRRQSEHRDGQSLVLYEGLVS